MDLGESSVFAEARTDESPAESYPGHWSTKQAEVAGAGATTTATLAQLLTPFAPITLAQMKEVALLDRAETKYFLHRRLLPQLLAAL